MAPLLFGWPLVGDTAVLSGGSWRAALPLSNAQTKFLSERARTTNADLTSTIINIDHSAATALSVVALVRHNMRSAAQWRIRASANSDMSSPVLDTNWMNVWGVQWDAGVLPAGHPNAATRLLTDAQIVALDPPRDAVYVVEPEVSARYWRIEIADELNADDYIEIGRLVLAPRFQPSYNFSVGAEFGFVDSTQVNTSLSSARYYDERPKGRSLAMQFQNLPDREAYSVLRDMLEQLGQAGQVYVVTDPADVASLQRRSFLANVRQLSAVQYAAAGYSTVPLVVDEVL